MKRCNEHDKEGAANSAKALQFCRDIVELQASDAKGSIPEPEPTFAKILSHSCAVSVPTRGCCWIKDTSFGRTRPSGLLDKRLEGHKPNDDFDCEDQAKQILDLCRQDHIKAFRLAGMALSAWHR